MSAPLVITGVAERKSADLLLTYPNPTTGLLTLSGSFSKSSSFQVTIFNSFGKRVMAGENQLTFDLRSLPDGIYFIQMKTNNKLLTAKIILVK